MPDETEFGCAASRRIVWPHGSAEVQARGAMLAPVIFRAPGHPSFSPLQIAPWAEEPSADRWPGLLGRLRGEWPCAPFGRCDRPAGLPADWPALEPANTWGHGYASHHDWRWISEVTDDSATTLTLQVDPPGDPVIQRLTRTIRAMPDAPALEIELRIDAHRAGTLPIALHPTLRLDAGRVALELAYAGPGLNYPVPAEPGRSRLQPGAIFTSLAAVPLTDGSSADLTRYPQPTDSEELLQLMSMRGPVTAHYLDAGWSLTLDWDHALLPDLMLWISHRGRLHPPWNGRHLALGLEPANSTWDLARVTSVPTDHPLAGRTGLTLTPDAPSVIRYRIAAVPHQQGVERPNRDRQQATGCPAQ